MAESESTTNMPAASDDGHDGNDDNDSEPARKRQRIRLSCLECRRRKLSCSRELPCDRCLKSGTPDRCSYESKPGGPTTTAASLAGEKTSFSPVAPLVSFGAGSDNARRPSGNHPPARREADNSLLKDAARDHERIRKLELEVAQLRTTLSKQSSVDGSTIAASPSTIKDVAKETHVVTSCASFIPETAHGYRGNSFRSRYYGPYNAWSALQELTGIHPFMRETADEWLRPLNIQKKDRAKRQEDRDKKFAEPDPFLESILPSKDETDSLIAVYLDQFEQLHRIVHIPTFKKEYAAFWDPSHERCASFTALVLSMIAVSCCMDMQASNKFVGIKSSSFQTAEKWTTACVEWHGRQSQKHRRLVHYQIACLLYLAKKVNIIKKKRFWTTAGSMIREAITIGLHQDPDHAGKRISPYNAEMRRRLWATMVEFDVQASHNQGVPTLLSQVYNDTDAPGNLDDESFDESSTELPISRPRLEYTFSSYAHLSRQSLPLRLELNKLLTGPPVDLEWEQVLQYSDMITQEIDALPEWDLEMEENSEMSHKPILAHTLLHVQLRQYLIPLHQPYLKLRKYHSKYQTAEFVYYSAARDLVMMHDRLFQKGIRALYFLREDSLRAAMNLCNVSLHQPKGTIVPVSSQYAANRPAASTGLIMSNAQETLGLIEKCIMIMEDRILRCGNNDPWGYSSMCAAYGLLETHLGIKILDNAKAKAAERFISLHYKLLAYQIPPFPTQQTQSDLATSQPNPDAISGPSSVSPFAMQLGATPLHREGPPLSMPWLLPTDTTQLLVPNPDVNFGMLDSDLTDLWGDWGGDFT
ncbi:Uu.00g068210.m01.CDS01 [Anthostomella pinea]|uniref:Uu.00g068210.m01.CDS01 n=1 Tax=Anthostomella pinea TaxID=933095 RepID=A0AAI8YNK2_9PEZI|nr:Uu.00g068210.m01.CDS01 [Anthostomella pinea]